MPIVQALRPVRGIAVALAIAVAGLSGAAPGAAQPQLLAPATFSTIAEPLIDTVVSITSGRFLTPEPGQPIPTPLDELLGPNGEPLEQTRGIGSGFVVDAGGLLVTNFHVIDQADVIWATFQDGTRLVATIVGIDPATDVALLRVNPARPLHPVTFGDSEAVHVGDWVIAIGSPFNFGGTVTVGILSARNRDLNAGPYDNYLQTDASINQGNSGGPLFNLAGEVIGINTAIFSQTTTSAGVAFAIPSTVVARVVGQLIEFGYVKRGRIGVRIQEVTDGIAEGLGLAGARGALVVQVFDDTPAVAAGMAIGDVVVALAGQEIAEMRDLPRIVSTLDVNTTVPVVILRDGRQITLNVEVQEVPPNPDLLIAEAPPAAPGALDGVNAAAIGLSLSEITPELQQRYGLTPAVAGGVVITGIAPASLASERPIEAGLVILEVGNDPLNAAVHSPVDVELRLAAAAANGRRVVLLLLANGEGLTRFEWVRLAR